GGWQWHTIRQRRSFAQVAAATEGLKRSAAMGWVDAVVAERLSTLDRAECAAAMEESSKANTTAMPTVGKFKVFTISGQVQAACMRCGPTGGTWFEQTADWRAPALSTPPPRGIEAAH